MIYPATQSKTLIGATLVSYLLFVSSAMSQTLSDEMCLVDLLQPGTSVSIARFPIGYIVRLADPDVNLSSTSTPFGNTFSRPGEPTRERQFAQAQVKAIDADHVVFEQERSGRKLLRRIARTAIVEVQAYPSELTPAPQAAEANRVVDPQLVIDVTRRFQRNGDVRIRVGIENHANVGIDDAEVLVELPESLTLKEYSGPVPSSGDLKTNNLRFKIAHMRSNESIRFEIVCNLVEAVAQLPEVTVQARSYQQVEVTASMRTSEYSNLQTSQPKEETPLYIEMKGPSPNAELPGGSVVAYQAVIYNRGRESLHNVALSWELSDGWQIAEDRLVEGAKPMGTKKLGTQELGTLGPGKSEPFSLSLEAVAPGEQTFILTGSASNVKDAKVSAVVEVTPSDFSTSSETLEPSLGPSRESLPRGQKRSLPRRSL